MILSRQVRAQARARAQVLELAGSLRRRKYSMQQWQQCHRERNSQTCPRSVATLPHTHQSRYTAFAPHSRHTTFLRCSASRGDLNTLPMDSTE